MLESGGVPVMSDGVGLPDVSNPGSY